MAWKAFLIPKERRAKRNVACQSEKLLIGRRSKSRTGGGHVGRRGRRSKDLNQENVSSYRSTKYETIFWAAFVCELYVYNILHLSYSYLIYSFSYYFYN